MALVFDKASKVITVEKPQRELTIQDLHDEIRLFEEKNQNLEVAQIVNASGKQDLGGGIQVGITLELINDWRLAFEARTDQEVEDEGFPPVAEGGAVLCFVRGGNLVATNIYNNNPIFSTQNTQVTIAQSSSATIITPPADYATLHMIESLRGRSVSVGNIWYWDPTSGVDSNNGTTPATAVATFAQAQTLASTGTPDNIIFALASAGGITTVTEKITISTPNIKLRGPGYTFKFDPNATGNTVTISANNVEFSGFYVTTETGGTDNGIVVTGDNALIKDVWVNGTTSNGIGISSSARTTIDTCAIENCAGNGINIGTTTSIAKVRQCIISGNTGDGADLAGGFTDITDNIFENNLIFNNTGWGIDVGSGVIRTGIRLHHTIAKNTAGSIDTTGSVDTFQDTSGAVTGGDIDAIVSGVWDELISAHTGTGSTGKTLRDAKVKATLASLK
ncbi:MAG TPA: right-handed parallel beta-helix repeat-containing protein [Patescibacteria group bacterium]|nr:right-handed parallel beta-helix repeat-containing protein [Patescibacteria group bacterium]